MKAQNWDGGTGWFWTAFIGLVLVTLLCFAVPVAVIVLVPLYLVVGITVMRQNQTQGPHRLLGFTLTALAGVMIFGVIFVLLMLPSRTGLYSSIIVSEPYFMGPGGYSLDMTVRARVTPENTQEVRGDESTATPAQ